MKSPICLLAAVSMAFLPSCITSRSEFTPENAQVTVGMPAKLSDRERTYISEVDRALRNEGYTPVRNGRGDMDLEFEIAEGPINIDTTITLSERRREIAKGFGRAAGAPLLKRDKVADTSFNRAIEEFRSNLPSASHQGYRGGNSNSPEEYVY